MKPDSGTQEGGKGMRKWGKGGFSDAEVERRLQGQGNKEAAKVV